MRRAARWVRRRAIALGRLALLVAPVPLVGVAVWAFAAQPVSDPMDRDALMAVAGIVGTVLSLGLTVTMLVAQHTAERYSRELYEQFRRENAWLRVLGMLGVGVVLIIGAALLRPTVSTGWAALALTGALGLYAASLLPQMLDSLDALEACGQGHRAERQPDAGHRPSQSSVSRPKAQAGRRAEP